MSKGVLIIPVEITKASTSGGGCGAFLSLVIGVAIIGFLIINSHRINDEKARATPIPVTPRITIDNVPHHYPDTSQSVLVTESSPYIHTYAVIPKKVGIYDNRVLWNWNEETGLIGASTSTWGSGNTVLVVNQTGVIVELTDASFYRIEYMGAESVKLTDQVDRQYSNLNHLIPPIYVNAGQSFEYRLNPGYIDTENKLKWWVLYAWSGGESYSNLCEIESARIEYGFSRANHGFGAINFRVNETSYYTAYDYVSVRLWDTSCREVFRYQTSSIVAPGRWEGLVITNEGGVLFVEEREDEYLIRYIKV